VDKKPHITIRPISEAPNLQILKDNFGVDEKTVIVSFGDTIFCSEKGMSRDLLIHEMVHCERQKYNKNSAERWWELWFFDEKFRLQEELIAYAQQFKYCKKVYKDRNVLARILFALAEELASKDYGNICLVSDAQKQIRELS